MFSNLVADQSSMLFPSQIVVPSCELMPTWFGYSAPCALPPWASVGGVPWGSVAAKVHFALFSRIMGALFAWVACTPPFSAHPFSSMVLLTNGGILAMVVRLFLWKRSILVSRFRVFNLEFSV